MSSRTKQVKFYLDIESYEKLRKIAEQQSLTVPGLVKSITLQFLGESGDGDLISRVKELETKYEQLAHEVGRIEKDLALLLRKVYRKR